MASAIIHLCIAKKINEIIKINEKKFFLGSIAPDMSKFIGKTKLESHFLRDVNDNIPELDKFLEKYRNTLGDNDFNLGYYCHLFADKVWFGDFLCKFLNFEKEEIVINGEKKNLSNETIIKILYNDYKNLNVQLIDEYELDLSLFYEDIPIINSEIEEIDIDKLPVLINEMSIMIEDSSIRETVVLSMASICEFIDVVADEFIFLLREVGVLR